MIAKTQKSLINLLIIKFENFARKKIISMGSELSVVYTVIIQHIPIFVFVRILIRMFVYYVYTLIKIRTYNIRQLLVDRHHKTVRNNITNNYLQFDYPKQFIFTF